MSINSTLLPCINLLTNLLLFYYKKGNQKTFRNIKHIKLSKNDFVNVVLVWKSTRMFLQA